MANVATIGGARQSLEVFDYPTPLTGTSQPATAGVCVVAFQVDPVSGVVYLIDRITVSCTSTTATSAKIYVGDIAATNIVDATYEGNLDVADEVQPITVVGADAIRVVWEGASAGAVGAVRIQYRKARMTG